jgi:hypothetical protein
VSTSRSRSVSAAIVEEVGLEGLSWAPDEGFDQVLGDARGQERFTGVSFAAATSR